MMNQPHLSLVRHHSTVRTRLARHGVCAAVVMAPAIPAADVSVASPPSLTQGGCGDATNDLAFALIVMPYTYCLSRRNLRSGMHLRVR
jgi:hypothetical protein